MLMQTHEARLAALREELSRRGLDGFVVPISDEHLSEYVGGYAQRLAWLTGFGGSAGIWYCAAQAVSAAASRMAAKRDGNRMRFPLAMRRGSLANRRTRAKRRLCP